MTLRVSVDEIIAADPSGVLSIHSTWKRVRLGNIARVQNGFPFKSALFSKDGGTPLLRIRDVGSNDPDTYFTGDVDPDFIVQRGDIVIGMDGDFRAARWNGQDAALNQRVCRVVPTSTDYDFHFLLHTLQPYLDAVNRATSAITVKHLSSATVADLPLPLPPLAEQHRIVAAIEEAFSKLDAGEAGLRNVGQLLNRMRQAVLAAAVTGRLVPQDPTDTPATKLLADLGVEPIEPDGVPALPEGWAWSTLGAACDSIRNGIFVSRPPDLPPGVPILRIGAVRQLKLDLGDVRYAPVDIDKPAVQRCLLSPGDLLFTRYNGNPKFVGACAVVPKLNGPLLHPDKLIRAVVDGRVVDPNYVAMAASAGASRSFIERVTKTTAGQAGVAGSDLKLMPIPVPPLPEQLRIVAETERQLSFIHACEQAVEAGLQRSAALRRSVLKTAFAGRLVPQDPTDEPASVLLERIRAERAAAPKPARGRRQAKAAES